MKSENPTAEEIKAIIQQDKERRQKQAIARIQKVLEEERCSMEPLMVIKAGTVVGRIDITPLD